MPLEIAKLVFKKVSAMFSIYCQYIYQKMSWLYVLSQLSIIQIKDVHVNVADKRQITSDAVYQFNSLRVYWGLHIMIVDSAIKWNNLCMYSHKSMFILTVTVLWPFSSSEKHSASFVCSTGKIRFFFLECANIVDYFVLFKTNIICKYIWLVYSWLYIEER